MTYRSRLVALTVCRMPNPTAQFKTMKREIICGDCNAKRGPSDPRDVAAGYVTRKVVIRAKKPPELVRKTTVYDEGHTHITREVLSSLQCDGCGKKIADGEEAVAVTMWNKEREAEPRGWESEYQ